ncbi:MAG: hypothetical protein H7123_00660 [Thermoleophilia bacterium]|nr:hypothetical protein [Thermoleophilia bacterium]
MTDSTQQTITARQFRIATGVLTIGSMAVGLLLLDRLIAHFIGAISTYYGNDVVQRLSAGGPDLGSLTIGQWLVTAVSLIGIVLFVRGERIRMHKVNGHQRLAASTGCLQIIERPCRLHLFDTFIRRTSGFAGIMLLCWVLEASYSRYVAGLGWGLGLNSLSAVMSIASIFGLCVLVGLFVAAVSMFGMRVLATLRTTLTIVRARASYVAAMFWLGGSRRTFRELFGVDILSRPPPVAIRV